MSARQRQRALLVLLLVAWAVSATLSTSAALAASSLPPSAALASLLPLLLLTGLALSASRVEAARRAEAIAVFAAPATEVEECRGWKVARIASHAELCWLVGAFHGTYQASSEACCALGYDHPVPDPACSCGFHAWSSRAAALAYQAEQILTTREAGEDAAASAYVLLEVELFGEILEYEEGFRAQGQEVLGVHILPCAYCAAPPTRLTLLPGEVADLAVPTCLPCASAVSLTFGECSSRLGAELHAA